MIDEKLKTLFLFIESLEKQNEDNLVFQEIKRLHKALDDSSKKGHHSNEIQIMFHNKIEQAQQKGVTKDIVIYELYQIIKELVKKKLIFDKAFELNIDPLLYKKEMGFLFKGKPLD